jgi:hypothetical protein
MSPGEEQRYDHPHAHGYDCTSVMLSEEVAASLLGGQPRLPTRPLPVPPALDLAQRLLVRGGDDGHDLHERALVLTASALEQVERARVSAGRPATARARRALADGVREETAAHLRC